MSFFKRLFSGRSADEEAAHGDKLLESGDPGSAKLAFQKALEKSKDATEEARAKLQSRVDVCLDAIAEERIEEAERCIAQGDIDLARGELDGALEVAVAGSVRERAQTLLDGLEREEAIAQAESTEATPEEMLRALAGNWEDAQAREYDEYGEAFDAAVLQLLDGDIRAALSGLEAILDEAEEPRFLWFEVGRAYFELEAPTTEEVQEGVDALETFLDCMEDHEGGEARLTTHRLLAHISDQQGDVDAAIEELERACAALQDDPRPYQALGAYLRGKGRGRESVEVLELGLRGTEETPDIMYLTELGLAYDTAGNRAVAIDTLESVLRTLATQKRTDFPTLTATHLARMHEEEGNLERAADLYRTLSTGSDRARHAEYHVEAGRLLLELDLETEATRMLKRARALLDERDLQIDKAAEAVAEDEPRVRALKEKALQGARSGAEKLRQTIARLEAGEDVSDDERPDDERPDDERPDDERPDDERPDDERPDDERPDDERPDDER